MKRQVKAKTDSKPRAMAKKTGRKAAAVSDAPKQPLSTPRKPRSTEVGNESRQTSKPAPASVASSSRAKTNDGRVRIAAKPVEAEGRAARSSGKHGPTKLREPAPTSQDPIQFPEEAARKIKTYLSTKQLREFKDVLLQKREELTGDVDRLTSEALKGKAQGYADQSTMPIHMAELGSDNWEQDFTIGLIANEQNLIREIDDALERIENKTYGMCLATDKPINLPRLQAKPWAKYCIEYERAREEGRAP